MTKENWSEIHEDFAKQDKRIVYINNKERHKTYQQIWERQGLTYQDVQEWIAEGFKPSDYDEVKKWKNHNLTPLEAKVWIELGLIPYDYDFASYLKQKNIQPRNLPKTIKELRREFNSWIKIAQNWLNTNYPNKQETKEIKIHLIIRGIN